jgi:hypothetical protein
VVTNFSLRTIGFCRTHWGDRDDDVGPNQWEGSRGPSPVLWQSIVAIDGGQGHEYAFIGLLLNVPNGSIAHQDMCSLKMGGRNHAARTAGLISGQVDADGLFVNVDIARLGPDDSPSTGFKLAQFASGCSCTASALRLHEPAEWLAGLG